MVFKTVHVQNRLLNYSFILFVPQLVLFYTHYKFAHQRRFAKCAKMSIFNYVTGFYYRRRIEKKNIVINVNILSYFFVLNTVQDETLEILQI